MWIFVSGLYFFVNHIYEFPSDMESLKPLTFSFHTLMEVCHTFFLRCYHFMYQI